MHDERLRIAHAALAPLDKALGAALGGIRALGLEAAAERLSYQGIKTAMRALYELQNELEIEGEENVPEQGGFLYASNHQSWMDVQVLGASSPRRVYFIAKSEFKEWPVLRHLIALNGSLYIERGNREAGLGRPRIDRKEARHGGPPGGTIDQVAAMLKQGKVLAIYPEGTIPGEEDIPRRAVDPATGLLRGRTGAVRMAIAAGVPIIPVGVSGTGRAFPPEIYPRLELLRPPGSSPVRVRFGKPISYKKLQGKTLDRDDYRRLTGELMAAISGLVDHRANYVPLELPLREPPRLKRPGVLLLHGFTSSLDCVNGLVPLLEKRGIPYRMPVLRGHGTSYRDLKGVRHRHWYADAERALLELAADVDQVIVVGLSMGGLLALELGMRHPDKVAGIATVAAALRFKDPLSAATPLLAKFVSYWPSPNAFADAELAKRNTNYPRFATDAFASLYVYSKELERRLPELHRPIRVIQSKSDTIVAPESANIIYEKVSSPDRDIVWFRESGHEMLMDLEAKAVMDSVMEFVDRFRAAAAPHQGNGTGKPASAAARTRALPPRPRSRRRAASGGALPREARPSP